MITKIILRRRRRSRAKVRWRRIRWKCRWRSVMTSVDVSDLTRRHLREKRPKERRRRIQRDLTGKCLRWRWGNRRHLRRKRPEK